jgi:hypothetical protein
LVDLNFSATILLITGCHVGVFGAWESNEFLGVVRQLLVATRAKAAVVSLTAVVDAAAPLFSDILVSALTCIDARRPWPLPPRRLPVGEAVEWARNCMRKLGADDLTPCALDDDLTFVEPEPKWWSSWFVVGDPSVEISEWNPWS